ncbi:MAG: uracil-DNA glycosylase family protein [Bacteriovoracaceae bacterium]|jgi:hypothetical protein|nr:uracil-DNA glycosylase family protein [Bacteriovoracaceae bacterium]
MDIKYRELLRKARENNDETASLLSLDWLYRGSSEKAQNEGLKQESPVKTAVKTEDITEKTRVLDSLEVFSQSKLQEGQDYKFKGGSLQKKQETAQTSDSSLEIGQLYTGESLLQQVKFVFGEQKTSERFSQVSLEQRKDIEVFFLTERVLENSAQEDISQEYQELAVFFELAVAQLFYRMIQAMQLTAGKYSVSSLYVDDKEQFDLVMSEIQWAQPKLIITLGAVATNKILQTGQRLKDIHGKLSQVELFYQKESLANYTVMPLFSPNLLQTAPNMKKTAWKDMQKAMEFLAR